MGPLRIVFVLVALGLVGPAAAQEWPSHLRPGDHPAPLAAEGVLGDVATVLGRWAEGPCLAVAVQGTTAYLGNGGYLVMADVSDPAHPVEQGRVLLPSTVTDLAVEGDYVYVAAYGGGLRIVDASDPAQPVEVGAFAMPGVAVSVAVRQAHVMVADRVSVYVLDVTDPTAPVALSRIQNATGSPSGVALVGEFGFVADRTTLRTYDLANPSSPRLLRSITTPGFAVDVAVQEDHLYLAEPPAGLRIFDVSDPAQPVEQGFLRETTIVGVGASDGRAYLASGDRLVLVDVTDPADPVSLGSLTLDGTTTAVLPVDGLVYAAASEGGLTLVDVADPAEPRVLGVVPTGGEVLAVAVQPGRAFLGEAGGLRVLDLSDPARPLPVAFVELAAVRGLVDDGTTLYLAAAPGLHVVDVADPAAPVVIGSVSYGGIPHDVVLAGDLAILADDFRNLQLIDVADPTRPERVGFIREPANARDLAVAGSYAYVAQNGDGLCIADITVPTQPDCISLLLQPEVQGVAVDGSTVYLADEVEGLVAVDVANPQTPGLSRTLELPGRPLDVTLAGATAYVAAMEGGLRLVDLQGFAEVGFLEAGRTVRDAVVVDDRVYVAAGSSGLYIADLIGGGTAADEAAPSVDTALLPPYPNPFGDTTRLGIRLGAAAHVRLHVFDALGRHLRTLVDAPRGPGLHALDWDGRDEAGRPVVAGVYFCRLTAGEVVLTVPVWRLPR